MLFITPMMAIELLDAVAARANRRQRRLTVKALPLIFCYFDQINLRSHGAPLRQQK